MRVAPYQWPADGSLPEHVQAFVDWVVDPHRDPKTFRDYERAQGLSTGIVHRWRKDDRVMKAIEKRSAELNINPERTQDVVNAIWRAAEQGDMKAAALYLQYIDRLTPKRVIVQDERIENLSAEAFAAELAKHGLSSE